MTAWYLLSCCSLSFSFLWLYHTLRLPCMDISEVLHWMMLSDGWCLTSSHKIWQSCSTLMVVTIMVVTRVNSETCAFMMSYMVSLPIKLPCVAFLVTSNVFIWQHFYVCVEGIPYSTYSSGNGAQQIWTDVTQGGFIMLWFLTVGFLSYLLGGLKKNAMTQGTNHLDAERAISKWFTGARDRNGNRVRVHRKLDDAPAAPK